MKVGIKSKMKENTKSDVKTNTVTNTTEHLVNYDYLRVLATFAVILLHVAASKWNYADVNGLEWQTYNFYDSIVRWAVPFFVMISGSLFLPRDSVEHIGKYGIHTSMCNPILAVPLMSVIVFVLSFVVSFICNHIPFINKYIA